MVRPLSRPNLRPDLRINSWFSQRTPSDLAPNPMAVALEERRSAGLRLVDLTVANPTLVALPGAEQHRAELGAALAAGARAPYTPHAQGIVSARQAVCQYYAERGLAADPDRIVITASTSESYGFLFKLLCDPGDRVLLPEPSYPLFEHLARLDAVDTASYPESQVPSFADASDGARVRAAVVVNPSNPTGTMLDRARLSAFAAAAGQHGAAIIGDEVFADYVWQGAEHTSVATVHDTLAFVLGGLSKAAGLPHLKLGWICINGPDKLSRAALARLELIADTYLSVAMPVQAALPALLSVGARIRGAIRERVGDNRARVAAMLGHGRLGYRLPPAGWCARIVLPPGMDDETAAVELLRGDGVHVYPGYFFDLPSGEPERDGDRGGDSLIVSLLPPAEVVADGLHCIAKRFGS